MKCFLQSRTRHKRERLVPFHTHPLVLEAGGWKVTTQREGEAEGRGGRERTQKADSPRSSVGLLHTTTSLSIKPTKDLLPCIKPTVLLCFTGPSLKAERKESGRGGVERKGGSADAGRAGKKDVQAHEHPG